MCRSLPALLVVIFVGAMSAIPAYGQTDGCAAIENVAQLLAANKVLLFGEIHGTEESPAFVGEVACHALAAGLAVTVALELPQRDQANLNSFLAVKGETAERNLLYSSFWRKSYQDGRTSVAMADLADRLRQLEDLGTLDVVLLDRPEARQGRDQVMASKLAAVVAQTPDGLVIALTGNMHNRTVPGAPWNSDYEPMGYLLEGMVSDKDLLALDVATTGGTAWVCLSNQPCQEQQLGGKGTSESFAVTMFETPDEIGFHGRYQVGEIHASPPAVTVQVR